LSSTKQIVVTAKILNSCIYVHSIHSSQSKRGKQLTIGFDCVHVSITVNSFPAGYLHRLKKKITAQTLNMIGFLEQEDLIVLLILTNY
jgi:hypothetical protein